MFVFDDRVIESSTGTTSPFALGGAVASYKPFSAARRPDGSLIQNGDVVPAYIEAVDANLVPTGQWEAGLYSYNSSTGLTRVSVLSSSNANAAVTFSAGTKIVAMGFLADHTLVLADDLASEWPIVTATPAVPGADRLKVYAAKKAGRIRLSQVGPSGWDGAFQMNMARNYVGVWKPPGNATTVPGVFGVAAVTATGTATARNIATTRFFTRANRLGYVSAGTAGSLAGQHQPAAQFTLGVPGTPNQGGFELVARFGCSDAATVAGARQFAGMTSSTSAPTNVEPSTLTNCIGVGHGAADSNLFLYYGGSAAQTPINLGANFPANTLSVDLYELTLYAPPNANNVVHYRVERLNTGDVAEGTLTAGTPGTQLPSNTTLLAYRAWRSNNATALAVGIDIASVTFEKDN